MVFNAAYVVCNNNKIEYLCFELRCFERENCYITLVYLVVTVQMRLINNNIYRNYLDLFFTPFASVIFRVNSIHMFHVTMPKAAPMCFSEGRSTAVRC